MSKQVHTINKAINFRDVISINAISLLFDKNRFK